MSKQPHSLMVLESGSSENYPQELTLRTHDQSPDDLSAKPSETTLPPQYIPILPKPLPPPVSSETKPKTLPPLIFSKVQPKSAPPSISSKIKSSRRCRVPICVTPDCNLQSHRLYARTKKSRGGSRSALVTLNDKHRSHSQNEIAGSTSKDPPSYQLFIDQAGVDGLPALPVDGLDPSAIRNLFHFFFSHDYGRILRILLPPPFTKGAKQAVQELKAKALTRAISAPIYCLHYAAAAHLQLMWSKDDGRPDRTSALLHGKVLNLLRAKLNDLVEEEIQDILAVIFTLCMFEISNRRLKSLTFHRDATMLLLNRCGGFQNINGTALAIYLTLDRMLSMFTDLPPMYEPAPSNFIRKAPTAPFAYGSYLTEATSLPLLGDDIHQYCYDVCRAIELLEQQSWSFEPDVRVHESPDVYYFFFLRDCIVNEFVRLNVRTAEDKTVGRCFLLATKIVEYTTLLDNYMPYLSHGIADKLQKLLCADDCNFIWQDHPATLTWAFFVLTSMANQWDNYPWAFGHLRRQLEMKYGVETWPTDWRQRELDNVRRHVWSDTRFNSRFTKTCHELQYTTADSCEFLTHQVELLR